MGMLWITGLSEPFHKVVTSKSWSICSFFFTHFIPHLLLLPCVAPFKARPIRKQWEKAAPWEKLNHPGLLLFTPDPTRCLSCCLFELWTSVWGVCERKTIRVCVCVWERKKERACILWRQGGGNSSTQSPVSRPPISFTPLLTRFSQHIYSPRGLLALFGFSRPQTGLCAVPLRQQEGRKQSCYTSCGAPDTIMSLCWPTHMTSQPGSHTENTETLLLHAHVYVSKNACNCVPIMYVGNSKVTHTHTQTGEQWG